MGNETYAESGAERRKHARLLLHLKFKYTITRPSTGEGGFTRNGVTKNISSAGLLFENKEQIPIDTELRIMLVMPESYPNRSLEVCGRVVRVEKLLPSENYDIGIIFIDMSDKQRGDIKEYIERLDILRLLEKVNRREVSDLHLTANSPPMVRCHGEIKPLDPNPLSSYEIRQMIYSILSEDQKKQFEMEKDLSFSFSPTHDSRYRVSIYQQRGNTETVFRNIMPEIRTRNELGLPEVIEDLCRLKDGIVIIGGTTGSGKSTTITTMIDIINRTRGGVVVSLEKPIEYLHKNIKAIVKQREVGSDVPTFVSGLKAALRQDPDIIVVGEILDSDSIETALEAAETGHLVVTSLHAADTVQVFDRIITFFPLDQRSFIYARLSNCLKAVIVQKLLPHNDGVNRVLAVEACLVNTAVKRIVHSGDFTQLSSIIQTGSQHKMQLMQDSLDELFERGLINAQTYEDYSKK